MSTKSCLTLPILRELYVKNDASLPFHYNVCYQNDGRRKEGWVQTDCIGSVQVIGIYCNVTLNSINM